jgi:putative DNA methylase
VTDKKKLIEVALPLEAINAACKKDKDRKTSTIRSIHKWFARMPVPALRALIFAALVDDPNDEGERKELMRLIEELVASGTESPPPETVVAARRRIASSEDNLPLVLDPFCGGGSTLVEAQRLGLRSYGSDLNPIPVLMSTALTQLPPSVVGKAPLRPTDALGGGSWGGLSGFLGDVRHYARRVREHAQAGLASAYPVGPNGDPVSAWIWARTVESPDPRYQGVHVPLVSNWWLSKRKGERAFISPRVDHDRRSVSYEIASNGEPGPSSKGHCIFSGAPISFKYIREKGKNDELGLALLAVVTSSKHGRYHAPDDEQVAAAQSSVPDKPLELDLPERALGFRVQGYGMHSWGQLFTPRQQLSLSTFADAVSLVPKWVREDGGDEELALAISTVLGLVVGKLSQQSSCLCRWFIDGRNGAGGVLAAFGSHHLSMSWDFVETNPFGGSVGDWLQVVEGALGAFTSVASDGPPSVVRQADARSVNGDLVRECLVVTDPPYFSAVGYANLSDYFYPWIRRALRSSYPELLATVATPKGGELIAEPARHNSADEAREYFIEGFTTTFYSLKNASRADLPLLIVYAFKEQADADGTIAAGWEAMLEAVLRAGLGIVGTWPIHGTGSARMRGQKSNALATYVVMVCRPARGVDRVSRREFAAALRAELGSAVKLLQAAAIAPVDLAQAVIGPGMGVFTRYEAVIEADGNPMSVRDALLLINAVLAELIEEQEGELDPDSRWALTWFEQHQFADGPFGQADALARAKVTSVDALDRSGIVDSRAGRVRLLRRDELPDGYDPQGDTRPTVWEMTQHLAKALAHGGERAAASLLVALGSNAGAARDLTYRLYGICSAKGWSEEAQIYNALAASWSEVARLESEVAASSQQQTIL